MPSLRTRRGLNLNHNEVMVGRVTELYMPSLRTRRGLNLNHNEVMVGR
ncbi:hypothetical protein O3S80_52300 [Streptomyces sp. Lzd4kr]|nr:hypothetical protein [Streptomyces sp. Lzd4kr]